MTLNTGLNNMGRTFPARLEKLYEMLSFIRDQANEAGFVEPIISRIELACEEALVNIINYGYPEYLGIIEIKCFQPPSRGIKIVIKDTGIPFNPLEGSKNFDLKASAEKRPQGGYGIFFILNLMDEVSYFREDQSNVLTLVKLIK